MKIINIIGKNYFGKWDKTRTACRGLIMDGSKILLSYETKTDQWMLPGGGLEGNESDEACCIREIAEETGVLAEVPECQLEIDEYAFRFSQLKDSLTQYDRTPLLPLPGMSPQRLRGMPTEWFQKAPI